MREPGSGAGGRGRSRAVDARVGHGALSEKPCSPGAVKDQCGNGAAAQPWPRKGPRSVPPHLPARSSSASRASSSTLQSHCHLIIVVSEERHCFRARKPRLSLRCYYSTALTMPVLPSVSADGSVKACAELDERLAIRRRDELCLRQRNAADSPAGQQLGCSWWGRRRARRTGALQNRRPRQPVRALLVQLLYIDH